MDKEKLLKYLKDKRADYGNAIAETYTGNEAEMDRHSLAMDSARWAAYNNIITRIENGQFDEEVKGDAQRPDNRST